MKLRRSDVLALGGLLAAGAVGSTGCAPGGIRWPFGKRAVVTRAVSEAPLQEPLEALSMDQPQEVASGDAYMRFDPGAQAWTLGNGRFEERLEIRPAMDGGFRLVRRHLFSRDRQVRLDVAEVPDEVDAVQDALGIAIEGTAPRLVPLDYRFDHLPDGMLYGFLHFRDEQSGAELLEEVRLRPHHPVVEHRSSLYNASENRLRLTRLNAADLVVRSGANARWRAATLDNMGNISLARLGRDGSLETETPAQSAARAPVVPLLILHDAANDEGLLFALRWSTNYRIKARSLRAGRVGVEAGVRMTTDPLVDSPEAIAQGTGFGVRPGQTITGPWVIIGLADGTMEETASVLTRYLVDDGPREPSWAAETMPVAWNSWFAYDVDVDYRSMLDEARRARELGLEVFYVDYGWSAAQGDWVPHPRRFPQRTLRQLSDQVHRMGMRFGLWVAFGVADPGSQLLKQHPEFRARQPIPARTGIGGSLPLCLTQARAWIQRDLARIIRDYRVDWLKFDQPMVAACLDYSHDHDPSVRGSLQANNQAFYDILRGLQLDFPEVFVESTFDGAGYLDYGVFAGSHGVWLDDASGDPQVPLTTVQQSFYGASLAFPARFLTLWLARSPVPLAEEVEGRSLSPEDLAYQGYSTMGGSWGISLRLGQLDAAQSRVIRALVAEYKQFRELMPGAQVYHLLPRMSASPGMGSGTFPLPLVIPGPRVQDWFALQYVHPETGHSAVLAVHNATGEDRQRVRLRGLTPAVSYQLAWSDGRPVVESTGAELMETGVVLDLTPQTGGILWITP
ncbi:MAG TPA: alpha-galactosidase [Chloroflexota bacterium]|nr:alpha-galactosidase [Chloroflexota bacterium]